MSLTAAKLADLYLAKQRVQRRDTGRVVWVSDETLRESPHEYQPVQEQAAPVRPRKERLQVKPQDTPSEAYQEVKRVRREEWDQKKSPRPPQDPERARKTREKEKALRSELTRVLEHGESPSPKKLRKLLEDLKGEYFPLGGKIHPGGRRLNKLIQMVEGLEKGKTAANIFALYEFAQQLMRDLFPDKFKGVKPDVRHEQVRKLLERYSQQG